MEEQCKTLYVLCLSVFNQGLQQLRIVETSSSTGVSRVIGSTRPDASGTAAVLLALAVPAVLTAVLKAVLTAALEAPEALAVLNTLVALKAVLTAVPAALVALVVLAALTVVLTAALEALEALVVPAALTVTVALKAVPADAVRSHLPPTTISPRFARS
ncbi:uncharacterized protein BO66DRAFT_436274 [Aspergillus aculeatinus CBS 121060]|uniref:Uncharacterized protein n=1 Tax=Aspergillus aculeatinus CBS 121060 TaxID=1448322 RepID=A0ACD1HFI4_9EURO|nr:hypothetical protein BO66DRAFT_436274 [Aspergillus aculeatinus CBS 121060]RAH72608.1 hypothetical protein BO66DRAFT_436274 [Aspergillus aculeatinus CBS 121060]